MKKTVSFLALLLLVLNAAPDKVFAGEADSTQEQEDDTDVTCGGLYKKIICAAIGKCQQTCKHNDDEKSGLKRRRRGAHLGSVSDSAHYTASSMWPSLTECVMASTESSGNTVSYPTMTTYSTDSPSSDMSIRCTMATTESYPSTSATSTDFMSASSASMPASYSSMPTSSASMASSSASMPPSSASMPSSYSSMPSSSASMPSSYSTMPPSSVSMPSSYSSMPSSSASMPSSYSTMPPSSVSMPSSYSTMPPSSASMPSIYSSMPTSSPSMPPSVASMPSSYSSMPPSSASMPANTASISPSPASTVSANTVSTMESASSVIVTTAQPSGTTNQEFQIKIQVSLAEFLGNNSLANAADNFAAQIAGHLNMNASRITNVQFTEQSATRRKRAASPASVVVVSFEIIPPTSASQESIAALESRLRNDVLGGNFTLTDTSGNPITVDTTFFYSASVSAVEAPEKRRDMVPIIVGTVVGVFCLALIFVIIVVVILKTKKPNKHNSLVSPTPSPSSSGGKPPRSPYGDSTAGPLPEKNSNDIRNQSSVVENETGPGTSTRPGSESQTQDR